MVSREEAERELSAIAGKSVALPRNALAHSASETGPACRSRGVMWGAIRGIRKSATRSTPWPGTRPNGWPTRSSVETAGRLGSSPMTPQRSPRHARTGTSDAHMAAEMCRPD